MKRKIESIKVQMFSAFVGLILAALIIIGVINYCFLDDIYLNHKKEMIFQTYQEINSMQDVSDDFSGQLNQIALKNNLSITITSPNFDVLNTTSRDSMILAGRLLGYYTGWYQEKVEILEKESNYLIQQTSDKNVRLNYLEMWGILDSGNYFIIRTPIESVNESAMISSRFLVIVGAVTILISGVIIWIWAKRFTRPITELTNISKRMTELDFDVKYSGRGYNEIDVLGDNFNLMSQELESTISELKTANNELMKDNENKTRIDEMRKDFINNVSHELKTPIALIQGYAEGLQENISDDAASREFYCEVIVDEAEKMNRMVKKLLTLTQLEFGNEQVVMERFELTGLIRGIIQSADILIQQKEAEVYFNEDPVYVWGDEFKVEDVVTNYLTNALNHVKYDKKIEIRIQEEDGHIRVSVFNTGDPIPAEELENIWIKFYKVDKARTREYGGSGIGLSIVKATMESMHQTCGVKNYENGVEFWFTLDGKK